MKKILAVGISVILMGLLASCGNMEDQESSEMIPFSKVDQEEILVESQISSDAEGEKIKVSSVGELLNVMQNDVSVLLAPGVYDLTAYTETEYTGQNLAEGVFMNPEGTVFLEELKNITLEAENPNKRTELQITNPYVPVFSMENCTSVTIRGLSLGHAAEPGTCTGSVLKMSDCSSISLENMDLYGCGTYGMEIYGGSDISLLESSIHHCTEGAIYAAGCASLLCEDCSVLNSIGSPLIFAAECDSVWFRKCSFRDNEGELVSDFQDHQNNSYITFEDCFFQEAVPQESEYITVTEN